MCECPNCERLEEDVDRWQAIAAARLEEATSYRRRLVTLERALLQDLSTPPGAAAAEGLRAIL